MRELALGLLARREHSRKELCAKLKLRGIEGELADAVLEQLSAERLQSDQRFAETYLHSRVQKGYGPVRLEQELYERGIGAQLIQSSLEGLDTNWMDILQSVRQKKFGRTLPAGFNEQAKESRFLQYRGFTTDQIRHLYKNKKTDDK